LPITIEEAKKNALDYLRQEVPDAQAEMLSAKSQDNKCLITFSWPVQKKGGTQCANVTVSESGNVEAYEKTAYSEDEDGKGKYTLQDFIPLLICFGVPSALLVLTIALLTSISVVEFSTIIFFLFLFTILAFLFAMKWLLWDQSYDDAFGLPQGSIRTVIALAVVFFALFVGIFKLTVPNEIVTLLAALVAFYFGATTAKSRGNGKNQQAQDGSAGGANL
jgi:hypothetical protein